jgi:metal-dependent HD superfamily phosphatase/phosphodiesterase
VRGSDLEGEAAHVGDVEDGRLLPAVGGGLHDAIFVLHRTPHCSCDCSMYPMIYDRMGSTRFLTAHSIVENHSPLF